MANWHGKKECNPTRKMSCYSTINICRPEYIDIKIKGLLTKEQLEKSKLIVL